MRVSSHTCISSVAFLWALWHQQSFRLMTRQRRLGSESAVRWSWEGSWISELKSYDFKFPALKFNLFEVLQRSFFEATKDLESANFFIIDAILLFFSEMNSGFLVTAFGPTLQRILDSRRPNTALSRLLSYNGMKVGLQALSCQDTDDRAQKSCAVFVCLWTDKRQFTGRRTATV